MASPDAAALLSLAESIADGVSIDWADTEARASGGDLAIIRQLRILSDLAGLHRSLPPGAEPESGVVPPRRTVVAPAIGSWAHLELLERLGGGTFGDVYRAWDRDLEREVALKLLRGDETIDDLHASRIAMEGRLLARVRHPNVITVYGVASYDDRVGLWMELVRGVTLEQQVAQHGPLSAHEAAMVGIDLCRALAAIHAAGLIHRDVKAQNVMREDGGRIVLMDLGTGRESGALGRTATPDLAGTPLYLAPEILRGTAASERTDLYSLGVLLYRLATGAFPVRATTMQELCEGHRKGQGVRLRDARPNLPTAFVGVVERAIAGDPERRYATAGELEADLAQALNEFTASGRIRTERRIEPLHEDRTLAWRLLRQPGVMAVTFALLLAIALVGWSALRRPVTPAGGPASSIRSIAVLPLVNLSGDPAQEYFADGMTEELIGTLGQIRGLDVISRTSSMRFKGSKTPLPEIAKALGVDAVLEGSVLVMPGSTAEQSGGSKRVRINARLIYAGKDTQLWDKTFETLVADVFALQREVAKAVADGINVRLTGEQRGAVPGSVHDAGQAHDFEAFNLYLKGRYYWNMRTEDGLNRSIQYFQAAIDRDRNYAPAYAGLADAYILLSTYARLPHADASSRASVAAAQALAIDGSLPEAHASLALVYMERFDWQAAETSLQRALALKPGYASGHHWYAIYLSKRGRLRDALVEIERALTLDPLSISINAELGALLMQARRYDDAIAQLEKTLDMDPAFYKAHLMLAATYARLADYSRALAELNTTAELSGGSAEQRGNVGYVLALVGRRAEALAEADGLIERYRTKEDDAAIGAAAIYAALGNSGLALQWLDRSRAARDSSIAYLKVDARFDNLRGDPRFEKILIELGLAG